MVGIASSEHDELTLSRNTTRMSELLDYQRLLWVNHASDTDPWIRVIHVQYHVEYTDHPQHDQLSVRHILMLFRVLGRCDGKYYFVWVYVFYRVQVYFGRV